MLSISRRNQTYPRGIIDTHRETGKSCGMCAKQFDWTSGGRNGALGSHVLRHPSEPKHQDLVQYTFYLIPKPWNCWIRNHCNSQFLVKAFVATNVCKRIVGRCEDVTHDLPQALSLKFVFLDSNLLGWELHCRGAQSLGLSNSNDTQFSHSLGIMHLGVAGYIYHPLWWPCSPFVGLATSGNVGSALLFVQPSSRHFGQRWVDIEIFCLDYISKEMWSNLSFISHPDSESCYVWRLTTQ